MKDDAERERRKAFDLAARREKSSKVMASSASSAEMRSLLGETMGSLLAGVKTEGLSNEQKIHLIMSKAKESGMTVNKIFSYFTDHPAHITKDEFKDGLAKLGNGMFTLDEGALSALISKFDVDGDGTISIAEFKVYCYYNINTVAWKAERRRVEESGEMDRLKAIINGHEVEHVIHEAEAKANASADSGGPEVEAPRIHCGPCVYKTTKLFWRTNTTVEVRLYYTKEVDIVSIQVFNQSEDREMPCLYVKRSTIQLKKEALDEAIKTAIQTSDAREKGVAASIAEKTTWEFYASYLLARLKLPDASNPFPMNEMRAKLPPLSPRGESLMPFLGKLADDTYDTLMIAKPIFLDNPPMIPKEVVISVSDFLQVFEQLNHDTKAIKSLRSSAEKMSKMLALSVNAFSNAEKSGHRKKDLKGPKKHWLTLLTRYIVQNSTDAVRERLKTSDAYKLLCEEQAEKKKAAGGA